MDCDWSAQIAFIFIYMFKKDCSGEGEGIKRHGNKVKTSAEEQVPTAGPGEPASHDDTNSSWQKYTS